MRYGQFEKLDGSNRMRSMELPICLMVDESAIFVKEESIAKIGKIYWMVKGEITPITREQLEQIRKS